MRSSGRLEGDAPRVRVILIVMLLVFAALGVVLWRVQVVHASEYLSDLERQSIRRVRLPGARGAIVDRNGICLADNRPSYCIAVYVEELCQPGRRGNTLDEVERVINGLVPVLGLPRELSRESIKQHIDFSRPLPLLAWRDIDSKTLARWAERKVSFPGVDLYIEPVRDYPLGSVGSHVLGHVGRLDIARDPANPYHYYLPEMEGKNGIERSQNTVLTGRTGGHFIRVDAMGYKHGVVKAMEPGRGSDVALTMDVRIQSMAEELMRGTNGAVVVMDPRNGDVLAMVSAPDFDPNVFSPVISTENWNRLANDEKGKPLLNRAIGEVYPPGSTFKPLIAIAALENGRATPDTSFTCPGYFSLGNATFHCWRKSGHSTIAMRKAIEQSCNVYFFELGLQTQYDRIYHMADAVGFGHKTGIKLNYEKAGLLPSDAWKRRTYNDAWRDGDTCNVSIGQGALLVTPLQMAMYASALANGGTVYRPRLIAGEDETPEPTMRMGWSAQTMEVVRGGMHDVVELDVGTGKRARVEGMHLGGKTGTAEYGTRENRRNHAWMIAFGPFENPRYAVAIVIENAMSGGRDAAPRIQTLMQGIVEMERQAARRADRVQT